jgi:type II secretory pathway predicted ATPase ExeA
VCVRALLSHIDSDPLHLRRDFRHVGFFETGQYHQLFAALKTAIRQGQLIAVSGIVGCGKTTLLKRVQEELVRDRETLVARSLAMDKDRINLGTLIMALFYDLSTEKEAKIPTQPEKRERQLLDLIKKRQKPVVLFIDEAHDLHGKTLTGLKRLMELVRHQGDILAVVLAGHPKLKNDLRRPSMEEIGARATILTLEGIQGQQHEYITWLLAQCTVSEDTHILTPEAVEVLAESLATPLQVEQYLTLALEAAYRAGHNPVTPEIITSVLATGLDDIESTLARHGYSAKALADLLHVRPAEIRSFFRGRLPAGRTQELQSELRTVGLPL